MPFPMKIQPFDPSSSIPFRTEPPKPAAKSRFKRLFERQFLMRVSSAEKLVVGGGKEVSDFEPSSVCLDKMVESFIEESNNEKQAKCGRNRCNCFNGSCDDSSDDEFDSPFGNGGDVPASDACDILKSLVPCCSVSERNLLADTAKIVEKNKNCKLKDECRKIVTDGLLSLGYDSSICISQWEKSHSFPAGEYEYIDVNVEGERMLIDVDFRSEFEIARSTKHYRSVLQSLPSIFVGKPDRLAQILAVVSEAAKQSLKKKGLHVPPWRKPEYMRAKWLSPYRRADTTTAPDECDGSENPARSFSGDLGLIFGEKEESEPEESLSVSADISGEEQIPVIVSPWQPPAIKPRVSGAKIVTGLTSVLREKP